MKLKLYYIFIVTFISMVCIPVIAQTKIIAHRGYWDCEGSAQNSLFSLQKAQEIGAYGSEFDVIITSDGVPVVNHDDKIDGMQIEDTSYAKLKDIKLKNGENLPTLESYLKQGKKSKKVKLILEIKPHFTEEKENRAAEIITKMVKKLGMENQVEYISFSINICKEIHRLQPKSKIAYLKGDLAPDEIKALGLSGLDYHYNVYRTNKSWIEEAHKLGLTVNVWTVNDPAVMQEMASQRVDFITTDKPLDFLK